MEVYYYECGLHDKVKLLEETEALLMQYANDYEAIKESIIKFINEKWKKAVIQVSEVSRKSKFRSWYKNRFILSV